MSKPIFKKTYIMTRDMDDKIYLHSNPPYKITTTTENSRLGETKVESGWYSDGRLIFITCDTEHQIPVSYDVPREVKMELWNPEH